MWKYRELSLTALIRDDNIQQTFEKVRSAHGCVVNSSEVGHWGQQLEQLEWALNLSLLQVKAMVQGRDRRPELGYKLALECRKMIVYPVKVVDNVDLLNP